MRQLISVIIPTYHRKESLIRLLHSLAKIVRRDDEIIVVEQGISYEKDYKQFACKYKLPLKYFFVNEPNRSKAKNMGARNAKYDFLLFFDDDVIVKDKIIESHLQNFQAPNVGATVGRVLTKGQTVKPNIHNTGKISFWGHFSDGFSSTIRQEVDTVIGCNMCWRKDVFNKTGGFDEQFTGAIREESDLSLRAKKLGYKIIFESEAVAEHLREEKGGGRKSDDRMRWYFDYFSIETYFFLKHRPLWIVPIIILTRWEYMLRCMLGFGREVSIRSLATPMRGIFDGIKKYKLYKRFLPGLQS